MSGKLPDHYCRAGTDDVYDEIKSESDSPCTDESLANDNAIAVLLFHNVSMLVKDFAQVLITRFDGIQYFFKFAAEHQFGHR